MPRRGSCPDCWLRVRVTEDGRVYSHRSPNDSHRHFVWCYGTGQLALMVDQDDIVAIIEKLADPKRNPRRGRST